MTQLLLFSAVYSRWQLLLCRSSNNSVRALFGAVEHGQKVPRVARQSLDLKGTLPLAYVILSWTTFPCPSARMTNCGFAVPANQYVTYIIAR